MKLLIWIILLVVKILNTSKSKQIETVRLVYKTKEDPPNNSTETEEIVP